MRNVSKYITCPNQLGFKKGHSTDMCIYVLKEMIEYFKSRSTSVFVTFLDTSKAYEKTDHWQLLRSYYTYMCNVRFTPFFH